jgi:hypothetical protein
VNFLWIKRKKLVVGGDSKVDELFIELSGPKVAAMTRLLK